MAKPGQLVIDARRDGRRDRAVDETVALEVAQGQREHALRYARDLAAKLVEALRALAERADDEHGPLVADPRQQGADRPADRIAGIFHRAVTSVFPGHKFVRRSQKNSFLRAIRLWLF